MLGRTILDLEMELGLREGSPPSLDTEMFLDTPFNRFLLIFLDNPEVRWLSKYSIQVEPNDNLTIL